jgi:DNA-binding response OmpR family regulator
VNERILIVDDDPTVHEVARPYLERAGYVVESAMTGTDGLALTSFKDFGVVVVDQRLPDLPGDAVLEEVRRRSPVPVLMLSGAGGAEDRVHALTIGADDYLTKPFSPRELVARVAAVLRRVKPSGPIIRRGDMEIDSTLRVVRRGGRIVPVTTAEYRLLEVMARSPGRAFTRAELAERAFGQDHDALDRTIDVHVMNLRRKLEPGRSRRSSMIVTVFGTGYRFEAGDGD